MRDTERREDLAAQPLPDQREPLPTAETTPIPMDEAGLEKGDDRRMNDGRGMNDGPGMDDRDMDDRGMDADRGVTDDRGTAPQNRDIMPGAMPGDVPQAQDPQAQDTAQPVDAMPMRAQRAHDDDLFAGDFAERLRARWRELQADFVDDPQRAVREADEVVDEVMRTIAEHRARLAGEWQGHTDTEHLRLALRGYRSFFDRLLPS